MKIFYFFLVLRLVRLICLTFTTVLASSTDAFFFALVFTCLVTKRLFKSFLFFFTRAVTRFLPGKRWLSVPCVSNRHLLFTGTTSDRQKRGHRQETEFYILQVPVRTYRTLGIYNLTSEYYSSLSFYRGKSDC